MLNLRPWTVRPIYAFLKPIFHLATLFARHEAKTRIRHRDWLKLAGEKIRREQLGTVPTFLCVRANKFAQWKTGLTELRGMVDGRSSAIDRTSDLYRAQW